MKANLLETWLKLKRQADASDAAILERMARAYATGYARIDKRVEALTEHIEALQKLGTVTPLQIRKTAAYAALIAAVNTELDDFSGYMRTEIAVAAEESAKAGLVAGNDLLITAVAMAFGMEAADIPAGSITKATPTALDFLEEYLNPKGVLFGKINELSGYHADKIAAGILDMVGQGKNPRTIASWITDSYGMGLTDSLRMTRTTQLYSYRNAEAATRAANADILQGSVWCAELDDVCCMSCASLHGQVFPIDAICDDHHNGRCALLPYVKGADNPIQQTGVDWFSEQSVFTQKNMMGAAKYEAWKDGKFELSQLSKEYQNDVFGTMRGETPLKDLIGE